MQELKELRF